MTHQGRPSLTATGGAEESQAAIGDAISSSWNQSPRHWWKQDRSEAAEQVLLNAATSDERVGL